MHRAWARGGSTLIARAEVQPLRVRGRKDVGELAAFAQRLVSALSDTDSAQAGQLSQHIATHSGPRSMMGMFFKTCAATPESHDAHARHRAPFHSNYETSRRWPRRGFTHGDGATLHRHSMVISTARSESAPYPTKVA